MEFTGTNLVLKRNFYSQTGQYGFVLDCVVDNTTGQYLFGLSGSQNNNTLEFKLESGKIYYGSEFIHTYKSYQPFIIEANFSSGALNIDKDNTALVYGHPKSTGAFDYFYFKRENAGMGATFDLNISGNNTADYTVQYQGYLFTSGQNAVTGYFVNRDVFPINIFDSSILATQNYSFGKIKGIINTNTSGYFAYSGDFETIDLSQPILTTFNTNYEDAVILFTIIDARAYNRFVELTGPTDFTFNSTGILARDLSYLNYSGGFVTNGFSTSLTFSLSYISGGGPFTGSWNFFTGVDASTLVSLKVPGQFDSTMMSGSGLFPPNSQISFQITHNITGSNLDESRLIISGADVLSGINRRLVN